MYGKLYHRVDAHFTTETLLNDAFDFPLSLCISQVFFKIRKKGLQNRGLLSNT